MSDPVSSDDSDVVILDPKPRLTTTRTRLRSSPAVKNDATGQPTLSASGMAASRPTLSLQRAKNKSSPRPSLPIGVPRPPTKKKRLSPLTTTDKARLAREPTPVELLALDPPPPPIDSRPLTPTQPRTSRSLASSSSTAQSSKPASAVKTAVTSTTTPSPSPPPLPSSQIPVQTETVATTTTSRRKRPRPPACEMAQPSPAAQRIATASSSISTRDRSAKRHRAAVVVPPSTAAAAAPCPSPTTDDQLSTLLRSTDFVSLDPTSTYGLQSSLLFQIEHVQLGPLTYEQGSRRRVPPGGGGGGAVAAGMIGARAAAPPPQASGAKKEVPSVVPSWAKTADGREWEDDLIRRLGTRLVASASNHHHPHQRSTVDALVPPVFVADVHDLCLTRLGSNGATECYLLGRGGEYPCKTVVLQGWILDREYREKENSHVYTIDDGIGIVAVHCAISAPPFASSTTTSAPVSHLSTAIAPPRDLQRYTAQLHAERKFAALEERAERQSDKAVLPVGKAVKVVGTVEEPRNVWDTERRIVATRVEIVDDINQMSSHLLEVARLHEEVYGGRFDVEARLVALERAEKERQQREWAEGTSSAASSSAPNSPFKSGREPIRPTAPARLPAEKITLYGFILYIKLHVQRHYLQTIKSSSSDEVHNGTTAAPPSSPSPFGVSDLSTTDDAGIEIAIPFSLPQLKANKQLSIFATRLAQEQARLKEQARVEKLENARRWGTLGLAVRGAMGEGDGRGGGGGGGVDETPTKGRAWVGPNPYLRRDDATPALDYGPSSTSSKPQESGLRRRRERRRCDTILFWEEAGPLYDDELADAVGKVWRTAIRTMRSWGMVIEYAEPEPAQEPTRTSAWREADLPQLDRTDELPDLPRHEERSTTVLRTPRKRKSPAATVVSNCPWGDVRLEGSTDDEGAVSTPRAVKRSKVADDRKEEADGPAPGCPWGDVKLFDDEDDPEDPTTPVRADVRSSRQAGTSTTRFSPTTERPIRSPSPEFDIPLPPSAQRPSSPAAAARVKRSPSSYSDCSDTSIMTTGSLADADGDDTRAPPPAQRFQLVTAASLCPLIEHLVKSIYATDTRLTSVSEADVRKRMYLDSQWEAVGRHGDQVTEALDLLCLDGVLQRHGQGFRPTHRW
ncbi:hypothetical protein B0A53_03912 [Rhodotorula sp. CCFEE 5036]|nr:hypothetical protein B0A53_03912 [Rhodotorula sp. CCFEE 5036]